MLVILQIENFSSFCFYFETLYSVVIRIIISRVPEGLKKSKTFRDSKLAEAEAGHDTGS